jgi:hypothetical protein
MLIWLKENNLPVVDEISFEGVRDLKEFRKEVKPTKFRKALLAFFVTVTIFAVATTPLSPPTSTTHVAKASQTRSLAASPPETAWNRTYGGNSMDCATSIQQTTDGGYIIAGYTYSFGAGSADFWLVKTDGTGNQQWNKTYGGTGSEVASSVQQTTDGGYIVAGETESFGAGSTDFWLVKTDRSGNKLWSKTYGGANTENAFSVYQTTDGGYIVAGYTESFGPGPQNFWLVKTDESGKQLWNKTYGGLNTYGAAFSIQQTSDGGYVAVGTSRPVIGPSFLGFFLVKTDATGSQEWNETYGGTSLGNGAPYSVRQTSDNGYILAGWIDLFGPTYHDFWVAKADSSGTEKWNKTYGGAYDDEAHSVQPTRDGGYIIAGFRSTSWYSGSDDFWLVKIDGTGNEQWNKTYGGPNTDEARSVQQTSDGGYIVAGSTVSFGAGSDDFWVVKIGSASTGELPAAIIAVVGIVVVATIGVVVLVATKRKK